MTPPLSLPALLALIEEATPGPWEVMGLTGERLGDSSDVTNDVGAWVCIATHPDAAYVANFDPPTVRVLIEALQEAVEALVGLHDTVVACKTGRCRCEQALTHAKDTVASISAAITLPEQTCPHGDPFCPCPDGDPCHYEDLPGSPAMTMTLTADEVARVQVDGPHAHPGPPTPKAEP